MAAFNVSAEDPFLWRSLRGYHIVFHRMDYADGPWVPGSGGLAVSVDGVHWVACPTPIYTTTVQLNGTVTSFARRERPEMHFDPSGSGAIIGLATGVERVVHVTGIPSLSIYTPVRTTQTMGCETQ